MDLKAARPVCERTSRRDEKDADECAEAPGSADDPHTATRALPSAHPPGPPDAWAATPLNRLSPRGIYGEFRGTADFPEPRPHTLVKEPPSPTDGGSRGNREERKRGRPLREFNKCSRSESPK